MTKREDFKALAILTPDTSTERQVGESGKAFSAYCIYRDMGPNVRNIRDVAKSVDKSTEMIGRWSRDWRWVERCRLFDNQMSAFLVRDYEEKLAKTNDAIIKVTTGMLVKVAQRLKTLDIDELSPKDIAMWIQIIADLQRRALGQPTQIVQEHKTVDSRVEVTVEDKNASTAEDLSRMKEILKTLRDTGALYDFDTSKAIDIQSSPVNEQAGNGPTGANEEANDPKTK